MRAGGRRTVFLLAGCLALAAAGARAASSPASLSRVETAYADLNDASGAISFIDSGAVETYRGRTRDEWDQLRRKAREQVQQGLDGVAASELSPADVRAVAIMRSSLADAQDSLAPDTRCEDARRKDIDYDALRAAAYACFSALSNALEFEGRQVTRVGAFDLLARMDEPERRKALFLRFLPLWQALDGKGERDSPYRRIIKMAAARDGGTAIDAAAKTVGASPAEVEQWLLRILDAWRQADAGDPMEPWDYRYRGGAAERELAGAVTRAALRPVNEKFYRDLGVSLDAWNVIYDLDPRPGKAPLAYTDYVKRGRMRDGKWQPTLARVSGNYAQGGLGLMNELVHENGHVVHMMALRTRPAFMDLGDALFYEAFADVPSWSTYEPSWQRKYLGRGVAEQTSLRALYSNVMLDVAWALFELRMLRDPAQDPNSVWTEITTRYLNVKPHPELPWWLVRVQLVDSPGYMVNYGLGAIVTADLRQRIASQLGPFDSGERRWFAWLAENLLASGQEKETAELLRGFLGRSVSPEALLLQIRRLRDEGSAR